MKRLCTSSGNSGCHLHVCPSKMLKWAGQMAVVFRTSLMVVSQMSSLDSTTSAMLHSAQQRAHEARPCQSTSAMVQPLLPKIIESLLHQLLIHRGQNSTLGKTGDPRQALERPWKDLGYHVMLLRFMFSLERGFEWQTTILEPEASEMPVSKHVNVHRLAHCNE